MDSLVVWWLRTQRHFNNIPIVVSVNSTERIHRIFRQICREIRTEDKGGRTKKLLQLADAGYHDRELKSLFFSVRFCCVEQFLVLVLVLLLLYAVAHMLWCMHFAAWICIPGSSLCFHV